MEITAHREPPPAEAVAQLVARCRPELEALFRRHWVYDEEADELLDDALATLMVRWDHLEIPASWLLRTLERAIPCRLLVPLFSEDRPESADPETPVALFSSEE